MYLLKAAKEQTTRKSLPIYLSTGIYAVPTTGSSGADNQEKFTYPFIYDVSTTDS